MLTTLRLQNYRGFEDHIIPFRPTTILVGRNNAGKSTIVEALRLVALVARRYGALVFTKPPKWLDLPQSTRGVSPSLKNLEVDLQTVFYHYGDPPAILTAKFSTGESISIFVGTEGIYAVIRDQDDRILTTKGSARDFNLPLVDILPQVAPLTREERILNPDYVRSALSSALSPLHFRNQLHVMYGLFPEFKRAVEETWKGLRLRSLGGRAHWPSENILSLLVQDGDFTAEASWMGHGLQMWLQTMWFLVRAKDASCVILDEPDVYMHADLQRRLIRYIRGRFPQVIVATHSIEIMAEVRPEEILIVDKAKPASKFATSLPAVQRVVENVGSVHNIQLARLWNSRRFLMIEGDDLGYLKRFQDILQPNSELPFDTIPSMEINGWGGWNYAVGSSMFLENAGGEGIVVYCLLDSDYHPDADIQRRYDDAAQRGVQLHIWKRKEIENYLLVPGAIRRVVLADLLEGCTAPNASDIDTLLETVAEGLKEETFDAIGSEIQKQNRGWETATVNQKARLVLNASWGSLEGKLSIISGKRALSIISEVCKQRFGVSFGPMRVARELKRDEILDEVRLVITSIAAGTPFPPRPTHLQAGPPSNRRG